MKPQRINVFHQSLDQVKINLTSWATRHFTILYTVDTSDSHFVLNIHIKFVNNVMSTELKISIGKNHQLDRHFKCHNNWKSQIKISIVFISLQSSPLTPWRISVFHQSLNQVKINLTSWSNRHFTVLYTVGVSDWLH